MGCFVDVLCGCVVWSVVWGMRQGCGVGVWCSATLSQQAILGESDPNFPWEKFLLGQKSEEKKSSWEKFFSDSTLYHLSFSHLFNWSCGHFYFS